MGRKPLGDRALTPAERQARKREAKTEQVERWHEALVRIQTAKTVREAREIATKALKDT